MVHRLAQLSKSRSFFLLGPRGVGKSTLVKTRFKSQSLYIDLLDPEEEDRFRLAPGELKQQILAAKGVRWVIIDEIQKLPRLLDTVHQLIESTKLKFILSGSSARKLKRGGANLLAGRAFVFYLHGLSVFELYEQTPPSPTQLNTYLRWGLLPEVHNIKSTVDKIEYLKAYTTTYLKEEVQLEQIVRKLTPFRQFLQLVAQTNGQVINFSKLARDIGVETNTVQNYYSILEDTLLGFYLRPYHRSVRKRQHQAPKFYLFDTGVVRALNQHLDVALKSSTYDYGHIFEHFIILEFIKLAEYYRKNWSFYYLLTKNGVEVDLIVDRPARKPLCIEIKSTRHLTQDHIKHLHSIGRDMPGAKLYALSQDPQAKIIKGVRCVPWYQGLKEIFKI